MIYGAAGLLSEGRRAALRRLPDKRAVGPLRVSPQGSDRRDTLSERRLDLPTACVEGGQVDHVIEQVNDRVLEHLLAPLAFLIFWRLVLRAWPRARSLIGQRHRSREHKLREACPISNGELIANGYCPNCRGCHRVR
jgi:hypothetical protein